MVNGYSMFARPRAARSSVASGSRAATPGYSRETAIYAGTARVVDWEIRRRMGMTAKFQLRDVEDLPRHPFKGLHCRKLAGHRLHLGIFHQPDDEGEPVNLYTGEGQLISWLEDCTHGMLVSLRFDSGPDGAAHHPLADVEVGLREGEDVNLLCWALGDDETIQHPDEARRSARPWTSLDATQQANIRCRRDPLFQRWCEAMAPSLLSADDLARLPKFHADPANYAASLVRLWCGVESRSELRGEGPSAMAARRRWTDLLRRYDAWRFEAPA